MKRVILTIAVVLCAASAFADDHRGYRNGDNGHHYGHYRHQNSHGGRDCRDERGWGPGHVVYRPEYREVRELPSRYVTYRPEYRKAEPHVTISVQTPGLILSFLTGR